MAGLALIVFGFGLLVAWLVWAIDSCDGGGIGGES